MNRLKESYSGCMNCGGKVKMKSGGNWIKGAIKKPGSFTAQANKAGMSVPAFRNKVLSNKGAYSSTTVKRANLAKTLAGMRKGEDGMTVSKRDLKEARKDVMAIEPKGITAESSMGMPTAPNTIESPANWYNESTWDKAQAENAARPIANAAVAAGTSSATTATSAKTPLARGGTEKVRAYQEMLRSKGFDIATDGAWGPKTQAAYESYIKSKTAGTQVENKVQPAAKTSATASSETWNYTPQQWDKAMAENNARATANTNSGMSNASNLKQTAINPQQLSKVVEPAAVTEAMANVGKLKKAKDKMSKAKRTLNNILAEAKVYNSIRP
jgi:hypothetical protein